MMFHWLWMWFIDFEYLESVSAIVWYPAGLGGNCGGGCH